MGDEFHAVLKLITGEEIFSLVSVDENDGDSIIMLSNPVIMKNADVIVITENNLDEVIQKVKALQGGQFVVYGLDLKSFENLAINMEQIKRYIEQQNEVILYYEKSIREEPEIVEEDLDG